MKVKIKIKKEDFKNKLGLKDGENGLNGSPDTADQVVDKVNSSKKLIDKSKIEGLADIERMAKENQLPITTSFFNGLRAKNLNVVGATATQTGDTVNIQLNSILASITTNTTLTASNSIVLASGTTTITLPDANGIQGRTYNIINVGTSQITLTPFGGQTISGDTNLILTNQWDSVVIMSNGANWVRIS
jgi:hypothetical protein